MNGLVLCMHGVFLIALSGRTDREINGGNYDVAIGVHAYCCLHLAIVRSKLNVPRTVGWMHNSYEAFLKEASVSSPVEGVFLQSDG